MDVAGKKLSAFELHAMSEVCRFAQKPCWGRFVRTPYSFERRSNALQTPRVPAALVRSAGHGAGTPIRCIDGLCRVRLRVPCQHCLVRAHPPRTSSFMQRASGQNGSLLIMTLPHSFDAL